MAKKKTDTPGGRILVVDDEKSMRDLLGIVLEGEGYDVTATDDGKEALARIREEHFDLVIQDLKMPKMDGIELLEKVRDIKPELMVIIITAFSTWDNACEAMRLGAYDYIKKPFDTDDIREIVSQAIERKDLYASLSMKSADEIFHIGELIGNNEKMKRLFETVRKIAPTDSSVLIYGESGTGKELVARAIHYGSLRSKEAFITVNCAAFTESLLESELFGHVKGSFTGAISDKKGLFEVANNGTFFLDEIAEMSIETQASFLRVLENSEFKPVGGVKLRKTNVRIIAATNKNPADLVAEKLFREDLYYRLNVIPIDLPALRDRKDDIPLLVGYFIKMYAEKMQKQVSSIDDGAMKRILLYDWPGNVRELENVIQRAMALATKTEIDETVLPENIRGAVAGAAGEGVAAQFPPDGLDLEKELERFEKALIEQALEHAEGDLRKTATLLSTTFRSLRYRIKKLAIKTK